MLVERDQPSGLALRWRRGVWLSLAVLVLSVLSLAPYLTSSTELVRMRNALVLIEERGHGFDWTPDSMPPDFMLERGPADPVFVEAAGRLGLAGMSSDWDKVTAISRHLLSNPHLVGTPIQSNLRDTYRHIIDNGTGYCGDFTRVFMAFAITAGIPVRAWSFSFDGFGGDGHIWPEIWNRQLKRWQLVDIFNNFYFQGQDGVPISAAEFRHAMLTAPKSIHRALLYPAARPGYGIEEKMWAWYRRGLPEWYMVWGNNVFSYDKALMVRHLGHFSRSLEQLEAIAIGVYPPVSLMVTETNRDKVNALWRLRFHFFVAACVGALAFVAFLLSLCFWFRARTRPSYQS
ncbi:MAG: transglutaminase domain-containing protein [Polaromonas sp.]|nr:transglutaminase domain-containing protein [Polaromonas sp.]